jgi:hypothetical protein
MEFSVNLFTNIDNKILNSVRVFTFAFYIGKGKVIPLKAWTGPEDSRRLRLPYFKTIGI